MLFAHLTRLAASRTCWTAGIRRPKRAQHPDRDQQLNQPEAGSALCRIHDEALTQPSSADHRARDSELHGSNSAPSGRGKLQFHDRIWICGEREGQHLVAFVRDEAARWGWLATERSAVQDRLLLVSIARGVPRVAQADGSTTAPASRAGLHLLGRLVAPQTKVNQKEPSRFVGGACRPGLFDLGAEHFHASSPLSHLCLTCIWPIRGSKSFVADELRVGQYLYFGFRRNCLLGSRIGWAEQFRRGE